MIFFNTWPNCSWNYKKKNHELENLEAPFAACGCPYPHARFRCQSLSVHCKSQNTPATVNTSSRARQNRLCGFCGESAVRHGVQFGAADTLPSVLCRVAGFLADSTTGELLSESSTGSSRPSPTPSPGTCCPEVSLPDSTNTLCAQRFTHLSIYPLVDLPPKLSMSCSSVLLLNVGRIVFAKFQFLALSATK